MIDWGVFGCLIDAVTEHLMSMKALKLLGTNLVISHLFYADDTLIVLPSKQRAVKVSKLDFDVV